MAPFPPGGPDSDLVRDKMVRTRSPYTLAMVSAEKKMIQATKYASASILLSTKVSMSNAKVSIPGK